MPHSSVSFVTQQLITGPLMSQYFIIVFKILIVPALPVSCLLTLSNNLLQSTFNLITKIAQNCIWLHITETQLKLLSFVLRNPKVGDSKDGMVGL